MGDRSRESRESGGVELAKSRERRSTSNTGRAEEQQQQPPVTEGPTRLACLDSAEPKARNMLITHIYVLRIILRFYSINSF